MKNKKQKTKIKTYNIQYIGSSGPYKKYCKVINQTNECMDRETPVYNAFYRLINYTANIACECEFECVQVLFEHKSKENTHFFFLVERKSGIHKDTKSKK